MREPTARTRQEHREHVTGASPTTSVVEVVGVELVGVDAEAVSDEPDGFGEPRHTDPCAPRKVRG
ncbi:hypothetical protein [Saccharothrix yanglingensis]|uniref:Uncharacterized protein n=1 Tax=Saccharothrix yanglingensis TaxID=659496 RepID=A0ABU0X9S7_9PSEU|nr:hypothetical protein [Saccharothrix yanglingensis]MDQ2588901.1 hypothetical protein [Saccharothrix yanglingensis]